MRKFVRLLRRTTIGAVAAVAMIAASPSFLPATSAHADPTANTWYRLRMCESSNRYTTNTGNGYYGAYQFDLSTWRSVGGAGYPNNASVAEQDARALILYRMRGWQPWECARILGLVEDSDARSRRTSDISVSTSRPTSSTPTASAPAWPGVQYLPGSYSAYLRQWQLQMKARGAPLVGTGYYGPNTEAVVKKVQALNGLRTSGILGPKTWAAAWTGDYTA